MTPRRPRAWRIADGAVIGILLAATGLPLVGTLLGLGQRPKGEDMRELAPVPTLEWNVASLRTLAERVEDYFNDHFGFRGPLVHALTAIKVGCLGVSSSANVLLGRDGWLYYSNAQVGTDYEEVRPFTAAELARWQRVLERRQEWLARRGCRYLLFIPPDKQTIYPEHLDPRLRPRHAGGRLDQLLAHLRAHSDVTVIDVRDALRRASRQERTYRVTDSHWNPCGAFVGYREVAQVLAGWFPQVRPLERAQFEGVERPARDSDLIDLLGLHEDAPEMVPDLEPRFPQQARRQFLPRTWVRAELKYAPPVEWDSPDTSLPRAVLLHDSFALGFHHLLAEHFHRMVSVWHDDFQPDLVEREQPDVVIHELVERKLGSIVPNDVEDGAR
jgi:hypothetical protein